jgi:enediyne biosynthesis protein E4
MKWTRRQALALSAWPLLGQGVATRNAKPLPRGKPSGIPFGARFTDIAAQAGLNAPVIYGGKDRKNYILETVGCGCAFFDYDNDGWLDILLLSGTLLENNPKEATNRLYKNNRDGTFTDVTDQAGLHRTGWATGVTIADFDNDGNEDIFITYWGQNVLYRNNGNGTFTDVTKQSGLILPGTHWSTGCTWLDYDRDGRLDLFVTSYLQFDTAHIQKPGEGAYCYWHGVPVNCGPRGLPPGRNWLFHNNGDGTFTDVSSKSGVTKATSGYGLTAVAADFDNDGWPDIYVANDSTPSLYFRNNHDGTFLEEGLERGVALNEDGAEQAGMGVGVGDYNLDGSLDIFKTHFSDDTNILYRNDGHGTFADETNRSGLGVETRYTGWGAGIIDLDNDGLPDLFLVTGSVYPEIEKTVPAYPFRTPRAVFRNLGDGRFEQLIAGAGPGIEAAHSSRGCAFGDFDNDGDIDILILNMNEPPSLLRNDLSRTANWLKILLIGEKSNRSAIGSRVTARYGNRRQAQEVAAQGSFLSVNDRRLHFGLGAATKADLDIRWTNGTLATYPSLAAGRLYVIHEKHGIMQPNSPPLK